MIDAARAERLHDIGIDHFRRRRAAGDDHDQRIDRLRHLDQVGIMLVRHAVGRIARMIDHGNARGVEPAPDRLADPAHADHPDLAVAQRADAQGIVLRRPQAGAQIAVGLDELAQGRDQKSHRDIGDLFGQHVGRIGDDDVVLARVIGIDVIVADAESWRRSRASENAPASCCRHAPYCRSPRRRGFSPATAGVNRSRSCLVSKECSTNWSEKPLFDDRLARPIDQQIDLLGRNIPASHQFSFPSALSCQRRNTRCEVSASSP